MRKEVRRELASQSRISAVLSQAEAEARLRAACGQSTVRLEPGWLRRCVGDGEAPAVTPSHRDLPLVCGGQLGLPFYLTCPHPCVLPCPPSRRPVCNVRKPSWTARRQAARAEPNLLSSQFDQSPQGAVAADRVRALYFVTQVENSVLFCSYTQVTHTRRRPGKARSAALLPSTHPASGQEEESPPITGRVGRTRRPRGSSG